MLAGLIFDFDGIIVDTEPLHYQAFQRILAPLGLGYTWQDYVDKYMGFDDRDAFVEAFKANGKPITAEQLQTLIQNKAKEFLNIIADGVKPYPGVIELIRSAEGSTPLALCSGALLGDILPILEQLGLVHAFDVIVTAEDVAASKPDPSSYILALSRLSEVFPQHAITPNTCLAIEDTPAGIASAKGASLPVIAVTNSYDRSHLTGAVLIVDSLSEVDLQILHKIVQ